MGIGFSQLTARNSLVSVHADSKGLRIEASKALIEKLKVTFAR